MSMTAVRSPKKNKEYKKFQKTPQFSDCAFCDLKNSGTILVRETKYFHIVQNRFPYSLWDDQRVTEHLMITPKDHVLGLGELSAAAKSEYIDLLEEYEKKGYNTFTRAPRSHSRTVAHYHTHLLQLDGNIIRVLVHLKKPYLRIVK